LIVNLADNDHRWRNTVIRVSGGWKTVEQKQYDAVPTAWNKETLLHREISITTGVQERVQCLLQLGID